VIGQEGVEIGRKREKRKTKEREERRSRREEGGPDYFISTTPPLPGLYNCYT